MRLLTLFLAFATALQAAIPLQNPRITGSDSKVASGTFTVESGATFAVEAGAFFTMAAALPLSSGGTGASLSDPGADRIFFWDDSANSTGFLSLGSNLSITGNTLNATAAPIDATYLVQTSNGTLTNEFALGSLPTGILKNTTSTGVPTIAAAGTDYVAPGALTGSGLNMASARLLGRSTASTGAVEEITVGSGLTLAGGTLTASGGGGGSGDVVGPASSTANRLALFDGTTGKLLLQSTAITESGGTLTSNTAIGLTAGGTNQNIPLTPSGTGYVLTTVSTGIGQILRGSSASGYVSQRFYNDQNSGGRALEQGYAGSTYSGAIMTGMPTGEGGYIATTGAYPLGFGVNNTFKFGLNSAGEFNVGTSTDRGAYDFQVNGASIFVGALNVGLPSASAPSGVFRIFGDTDSTVNLNSRRASADALNAYLSFSKSRGTIASPSAVSSGDGLGAVYGGGFDGSVHSDFGSYLKFFATQNWSSGSIGSKVVIATTPNNSATRADRMTVDQDGSIKIGDASATNGLGILQVYGTSDATSGTMLRRASADAFGAYFGGSKSRGTIASPSALVSGDQLSALVGGGYDGSAHSDFRAIVKLVATQNWSSGNTGSRIVFGTTPNNSATRTDRVTIDQDGSVEMSAGIASSSTTTGTLKVTGGAGFSGNAFVGGILNIVTSTPASASATGVAGTIAWDASYIYICTATNTWKRVAIATW